MNIGIIGLGVVGGSFAKAIRAHLNPSHKIMAIDIDEKTIEQALSEGIIDYGETTNQTILQQADLVIIALYPAALINFMQTNNHLFKKGAIVTETTGIKTDMIKALKDLIPDTIDFIFGHPMAGRENRGLDYASAEVFQGSNYLITPTENNQQETINWYASFVEAIGFKRVTFVTADQHDEMIAYTSQLAHIIAVSLINSDLENRNTALFIGDSYRDLTRIAKLNEDLWTELFLANKEELLKAINRFEIKVQDMKEAITNDDRLKMKGYFVESTQRRLKLEHEDSKFTQDSM
ncbi:prephenate dehydrogenase [Fundicoccus culcitae]|uniref:Prephenate dehydrogenase n=1 Tax=Fundicoccus culcitae TaxID=2969821 RepID=A0ABY5P612_9LACT|nr:prephenate dehydrogenase [Fundicoccus culcitae]UUX34179.1 prephenate dehydrogenase [Fundicoccus culcitae]